MQNRYDLMPSPSRWSVWPNRALFRRTIESRAMSYLGDSRVLFAAERTLLAITFVWTA